MDAATTTPTPLAPYTIKADDEGSGPSTTPTGSADDLFQALDMAWQLNRFTERSVTITDNRDGESRAVARVSVEWLDA